MNILFFVICLLYPVCTTLYNTDDDERVDGRVCNIGRLSLRAGETHYSDRPCVKAQCTSNPPRLILTGPKVSQAESVIIIHSETNNASGWVWHCAELEQ
uniref:Putative secreted protein n=1 Tax=Amblyomma triste TaxID=251400 RepID=A0A023G998_AMBTT